MKYYSTNDAAHRVNLAEAIFRGLPPDNGLYLPERIDPLPRSFFVELPKLSFTEISFRVASQLIGESVPEADLRRIIGGAINFPAPVIGLDDHTYILELFHGPSLAFKDFGARFMARLMAHFNREEERDLNILVATSGDTGGAVAAGFYRTPGIRVVILYPKGKVSQLQEKQLTTLGGNIHALEVEGTFDDCQALVKQAFLDEDLRRQLRLSSANSINISRLIPQTFYYFEACKQLPRDGRPVVFSVPSGNFGNLTAGLIATKLGLPIHHFVAATNANDVVPRYLTEGEYRPLPSVATLSNAMDVGAPSNFDRMQGLYREDESSHDMPTGILHRLRERVSGYAITDGETEATLRRVHGEHGYTLDPHGAVGYLALQRYRQTNPEVRGVILETAHPSKFKPDVERILQSTISVPKRLQELAHRKKEATEMGTDYQPFREWLIHYLR
jgi:threonine synthase